MEAFQVVLAEYNALRGEILARSGFQNTAILGCLAALVALAGASKFLYESRNELRATFGILSLTYFLVGWYLLAQDRQIAQIGHYIDHVLKAQLASLGPISGSFLGWDSFIHYQDFNSAGGTLLSTIRALAIYGPTYIPGFGLLALFYKLTRDASNEPLWAFWSGYTGWEVCVILGNIIAIAAGAFTAWTVAAGYRGIAFPD